METARMIDLTPSPAGTLSIYSRLLDAALSYAMLPRRTPEERTSMIRLIQTVRDELRANADRLYVHEENLNASSQG